MVALPKRLVACWTPVVVAAPNCGEFCRLPNKLEVCWVCCTVVGAKILEVGCVELLVAFITLPNKPGICCCVVVGAVVCAKVELPNKPRGFWVVVVVAENGVELEIVLMVELPPWVGLQNVEAPNKVCLGVSVPIFPKIFVPNCGVDEGICVVVALPNKPTLAFCWAVVTGDVPNKPVVCGVEAAKLLNKPVVWPEVTAKKPHKLQNYSWKQWKNR